MASLLSFLIFLLMTPSWAYGSEQKEELFSEKSTRSYTLKQGLKVVFVPLAAAGERLRERGKVVLKEPLSSGEGLNATFYLATDLPPEKMMAALKGAGL